MYHADLSAWTHINPFGRILVMSKITVWKKVLRCISVKEWLWEYAIAELECEETEILKFTEGKCRVPSVSVVAITNLRTDRAQPATASAAWTAAAAARDQAADPGRPAAAATLTPWNYNKSWQHNYGNLNYTNLSDGDVVSWYDHTKWVVGETVVCDKWDPNPLEQCSFGIHVFLTRKEAEAYKL